MIRPTSSRKAKQAAALTREANAEATEEKVIPAQAGRPRTDVRPTSFRLEAGLLDALTAWIYSDANANHLNRTQAVSAAIADFIGYRPPAE